MTFSGMGNMVAIDGKQFDMDRIDLRAKIGEKEVWEIKNTRDMMGGMIHPFHLQGVQFKVIIRNGNAPPANEQGWKDTIALYPGNSVRIEVTFPEKGIFYVPLPYPRARRQWHDGSSFSIMKIPTKLEEKDYVKILIVDDEASILDIVEAYLSAKGYQVFRALSGNEALTKVDVVQPDLIVLDLMLPGLSGLEVCKKIRDSSTVPIIMLTAKTAEKDILEGLSLGADDYITKPFSPKELVARVETVLRRVQPEYREEKWSFEEGLLVIYPDRKQVFKQGEEIILTPTEYALLALLASHPKRLFSREQLLDAVKGLDFDGTDRVIDTHIKNIRQKIEDDTRNPYFILTAYGMGYRFGGQK